MIEQYKQKVALLIAVLPYVSEEQHLALHGGTAINLFVREMPRLSVDIDLTYLPIKGRRESLESINEILGRIKTKAEKSIRSSKVYHDPIRCKLLINNEHAIIKLEVNTTIRGAIADPEKLLLCDKAQSEFEAFVEMSVVPFGQLFGGKICAALDRQHPRDMFDVQYLLDEEGFTDRVRAGFVFSLASSARPMHELLKPNVIDQKAAMTNQFAGMTDQEFSYEHFEKTRTRLVQTIQTELSARDKSFLLSISKLTPDWSIYDFAEFPAIRWKIQNLKTFKEKDKTKYQAHINALEEAIHG